MTTSPRSSLRELRSRGAVQVATVIATAVLVAASGRSPRPLNPLTAALTHDSRNTSQDGSHDVVQAR